MVDLQSESRILIKALLYCVLAYTFFYDFRLMLIFYAVFNFSSNIKVIATFFIDFNLNSEFFSTNDPIDSQTKKMIFVSFEIKVTKVSLIKKLFDPPLLQCAPTTEFN